MPWLWQLDIEVFRAVHVDGHRPWLDPLFWVLSTLGLGHVQIPLVLAALLPWREMHTRTEGNAIKRLATTLSKATRAEWRRAAGPLVLAWALSGLLNTLFLKELIERDRPSQLPWATPQETFFHGAFPSGHTASSFGLAFMGLFLTWRTEWRWVGICGLFLAGGVGFSRIYRGVHWPTDVLGGAAVALFGAGLAVLILDRFAPEWGLKPALK